MAMIKSWEETRTEARTETRADAVLTVLHASPALPCLDAARERILAQKDLELAEALARESRRRRFDRRGNR